MPKKLSKHNIWIVIPGYNEEKYIERVLKKVHQITPRVVFVDDGSTDKTVEIAKKHCKYVIAHSINLGKGAAMKTGCEYVFSHLDGEAVVFMDSDDQHDPNELTHFFTELKNGNHIVFGVRKFSTASMPLTRFLGNKIASAGVTVLFGSYIPDIPSGYKALTKKAYRRIRWNSTGYEVEMEIAVRTAKENIPFSVIEIETIYHDTDKGMTVLDGFLVLKHLLQWRIGL